MLEAVEHRPPQLRAYYQHQQRVMYATLLGIAWIHLRAPKRAVRDKLLDLLDVFHYDFNALILRELKYGAVLFTEGHRMKFFGRVQRSRPQLLANLVNMSWDLLIARRMEHHIGVGSRGGRFYAAYLLTFDQDLVRLIDTYSLRGTLLLPGGRAVSLPDDALMLLFEAQGLTLTDVTPYLTAEARGYRWDQHAVQPPNLDAPIGRLEAQLAWVM